jgi:hypothetical protein
MSSVQEALALVRTALDEEMAMIAVWTVSKLAETAENLKHIHEQGAF